jgi:hypothetical protein
MKSEQTASSLKEDQLLRDWFAGQSNWRTWRDLSDAVNVPYSSLRKYFHGRPIRIPEHRASIYRVTGIEAFRPDSRNDQRKAQSGLPPGQENKKTKLAIQLRQWLSQQGTFRSIAEMGRSTGIAESTLRDYFIGRALPSPKNLKILKQVTQIDVLDEIVEPGVLHKNKGPDGVVALDGGSFLSRVETLRKSFTVLSGELESLVREAIKRAKSCSRDSVDETSEGRSRTIAELLARLKGELEFFKAGSAEDREAFRRVVPGEQLGYVVSLLKALYDEGTFREWLHFSQLDFTEKR